MIAQLGPSLGYSRAVTDSYASDIDNDSGMRHLNCMLSWQQRKCQYPEDAGDILAHMKQWTQLLTCKQEA